MNNIHCANEKVCVIIPAKGKADKLDICIDSILKSDYPGLEVVVVDDGIEKSALILLNRFKGRVKLIKSGSRGPSFARNLAAKNTDAKFIAFTDSDCVVDKNWVSELLVGLGTHLEAISCGGRQEIPPDASDFEKRVALFMKEAGFITDYARQAKDNNIIDVKHNASCSSAYKKDVFLKEGGFLERLWPGEDLELDHRLKRKGYKLIFNPKAVVYHYRPDSIRKFSRMMYRYGKVQAQLLRMYGPFRKIHALPFISLAILAFLIMGKLWGIMSVVLGLLSFWLYFLITSKKVLQSFQLMQLFLLTYFSWHWGFLCGFFSKR